MKALLHSKRIPAFLVNSNSQEVFYPKKASVQVCMKYGGVSDAHKIADEISSHKMALSTMHVSADIKQGKAEEVLKNLQKIEQYVVESNPSAFVFILKTYAKSAEWEQIRRVHADIIQCGLELDVFIGSALIDIYAKSGNLLDAFQVFDMICSRDTVMWNAMIAGYTDQGYGRRALSLFGQMQQEGIKPTKGTLVTVLKACAILEALEEGKRIHVLIIWSGFGSNMHVESSLIDMYGKCSSIHDACRMFETMYERDMVSWNVMITVYAEQGLCEEALALYEQMKQEGMSPNNLTVLGMLKGCAKGVALKEGKYVHAQLVRSGFESDLHVINALIDMYAKCHCLKDARGIFDNVSEKSIVSWNVMLMGYTQQGLSMETITLYKHMHQHGIKPDIITYTTILKACTALAALELGKHVHAFIIKSGFESHVSLGSGLIEMYAKCKSIEDSLVVFNSMEKNNIAVWNALIAAYSEKGLDKQAFALFDRMQEEGVGLDAFTYVNILKVCTKMTRLDEGKAVHAQVVRTGLDFDHFILTSLVDMYAKCGCVEDAHHIFESLSHRDVVSWTGMISGYSQHGMWKEAVLLFKRMQQGGLQPDRLTFISILKICSGLVDLEWGKQIHADVLRCGFQSDVSLANTVVDMYVKCESIDRACEVFKNMCEWNVVSWNVMIAGFVQEGHDKEALQLFEAMRQVGVEPDRLTFISAMKACSMLGALEWGKQVHAQIKRCGFDLDVALCNTLIDMYAKCGSIGDACEMFDKMCEKDIVSWNVMIAGYAQHGLGKEAIATFEQMQAMQMKPDEVTFSSVLSACNHKGLKMEGCSQFYLFIVDYGVLPTMEHYTSVVDLLGRTGCLQEAEEFVNEMPMQPNVILWMALLVACRYHGDAAIGRCAFASVIELEPKSAAAYLLLSNIYAACGSWDEAAELQNKMDKV